MPLLSGVLPPKDACLRVSHDAQALKIYHAQKILRLRISKPAVSYILNTLEKKNYIVREIDPQDRRKISISATPEGVSAARRSAEKYNQAWEELLLQFGEDNMRQLVELLTSLNELSCSLGQKDKK